MEALLKNVNETLLDQHEKVTGNNSVIEQIQKKVAKIMQNLPDKEGFPFFWKNNQKFYKVSSLHY